MSWSDKTKNQEGGKSIFEDNSFLDGLLDWMGSPRGQLSEEVLETVWQILKNVDVDAENRRIIWQDGHRLSIGASVQRIYQEHREYPIDLIETHLIGWLEMEFAPETYSQEQLDELDELTEQWVKDYYNQARNA